MTEIVKRQVIELPIAAEIKPSDVFYVRSGFFDQQTPFSLIQEEIASQGGYLQQENHLSEFSADPSQARANLGLGNAAVRDAGSGPGMCLLVGADGKLPVIDGSNLTNIGGASSLNPGTAGDGLSIDSGLVLSVNVDGRSIEIADDKLQLRDSSITQYHMTTGAIKASSLAADTAGSGLALNASTGLSVQVDNNTIEIDNGKLRVKPQSITEDQIALNAKILEFIEVPKFRVPSDKILYPPAGKTMAQYRALVLNTLGMQNQPAEDPLGNYNYEVRSDSIRVYSTTGSWVDLRGYIVWAV